MSIRHESSYRPDARKLTSNFFNIYHFEHQVSSLLTNGDGDLVESQEKQVQRVTKMMLGSGWCKVKCD